MGCQSNWAVEEDNVLVQTRSRKLQVHLSYTHDDQQGVVAAGDVCVAEIIDKMSGANSSSVFQSIRDFAFNAFSNESIS